MIAGFLAVANQCVMMYTGLLVARVCYLCHLRERFGIIVFVSRLSGVCFHLESGVTYRVLGKDPESRFQKSGR